MSFKLNRVALVASFIVASPVWASDNTPPLAKPVVEILSLKLHPSDKGEVRPWKQIGVDPFRGDAEKGGEVLSKHSTIKPSDVLEAAAMRRRGECYEYYIQDGDNGRTTYGADKSMAFSVAFGTPLKDPSRRSDVCLVRNWVGGDTTAVVLHDGCGNFTAAWALIREIKPHPAPPASAPIKVERTPISEILLPKTATSVVIATETYESGAVYVTPGFGFSNQCFGVQLDGTVYVRRGEIRRGYEISLPQGR